ncbi:WD40 repeat-like-containing domain protein [Metarhizium album ARSEF 1941]|uniref:WD40 repeat-like-containing domain protein n=1 Tax=Metarhizium album (strain ARSEF 1941) TaxID=1081103 RepID=A0A0B2X704_METAS|nr:WD40 repeat-like-containing domain protein [Metarhizium album ARSEF 1941]KHO01086.1 WD40 repeat-like-containing domain protein [Metarhizium album ARSEF 1941]
MENPRAISSTERVLLDRPPSCLQFCPVNHSCFVVGTYNLQSLDPTEPQQDLPERSTFKRPQSRNGSLVLFHLAGDKLYVSIGGGGQCREISLAYFKSLETLNRKGWADDVTRVKLQTEPQPSAVLDVRFHPTRRQPQSVFAVVSSTGTLAIYRLNPGRGPAMEHVATSRCGDLEEDILFLQCSWHPSIDNLVAITTSTGLARLLHLDSAWSIQGWTDLDIQNNLEAWSICFSKSDNSRGETGEPTTVYCGGDDSILRYTTCSLVQGGNDAKIGSFPASIALKGMHNAGVTAILPLSAWTPAGWRVVVTGSYDDLLRVLAIHDPHETHGAKLAHSLTEIDLGGGVWRLDLIDLKSGLCGKASVHIILLASCMHAGARVVEIGTDDGQCWRSSVLAKFEEHQSMNYASDCVYNPHERRVTCVSTSFYDRLMCLWTHKL